MPTFMQDEQADLASRIRQSIKSMERSACSRSDGRLRKSSQNPSSRIRATGKAVRIPRPDRAWCPEAVGPNRRA